MEKNKKTQKKWFSFKNRVKPKTKILAKKLRKNPTNSEKELWKHLRKKQLGYKFRRQSVILGYIVDFYCPKKHLVIELDGMHHLLQIKEDKERDFNLLNYGFRTIRIPSSYVFTNLDGVLAQIKRFL